MDSVILEEDIDEDYEPTQAEIDEVHPQPRESDDAAAHALRGAVFRVVLRPVCDLAGHEAT